MKLHIFALFNLNNSLNVTFRCKNFKSLEDDCRARFLTFGFLNALRKPDRVFIVVRLPAARCCLFLDRMSAPSRPVLRPTGRPSRWTAGPEHGAARPEDSVRQFRSDGGSVSNRRQKKRTSMDRTSETRQAARDSRSKNTEIF